MKDQRNFEEMVEGACYLISAACASLCENYTLSLCVYLEKYDYRFVFIWSKRQRSDVSDCVSAVCHLSVWFAIVVSLSVKCAVSPGCFLG